MSIEALNWALSQQTGSSGRKAVLLILANRANENGKCFPGQSGIAEQANLSRRQVVRCINALVDDGFITVTHRGDGDGGRSSNLYTLNMGLSDNMSQGLSDNMSQGLSDIFAGLSDNLAGLSDNMSQEPKDNPKKNPKTIGRKTVPKDWMVSNEGAEFAGKKGMSPEEFEEELQLFKDHEFKTARKDFDACWRTWCTNWKKFKRKDNAKTQRPNEYDEVRRRLQARIEANDYAAS